MAERIPVLPGRLLQDVPLQRESLQAMLTHPWAGFEQDEANEYLICSELSGRWIAALRLNGELLTAQHRAIVQLLAAAPALVAALQVHHEWSLRRLPGYSEDGAEALAFRTTAAALARAGAARG